MDCPDCHVVEEMHPTPFNSAASMTGPGTPEVIVENSDSVGPLNCTCPTAAQLGTMVLHRLPCRVQVLRACALHVLVNMAHAFLPFHATPQLLSSARVAASASVALLIRVTGTKGLHARSPRSPTKLQPKEPYSSMGSASLSTHESTHDMEQNGRTYLQNEFVFDSQGGGGAWCMVHGAWCMVHGAWCMVHSTCLLNQNLRLGAS